MSEIPHIKITAGNDCCSTEVFVNGEKVDGVREIRFQKCAGTIPVLQLELLATDMEIDAYMIPALPEVFQPFYTEKNSENEVNSKDKKQRVGLSEDGIYATYELKFVQEIMHYLNEVDTDRSKELLRRMICPNPRKSDMSEEESHLRSMTRAERKAMLYGASLPKDSETLQILRKLEESVKSENCK